jgi:Family of unknown function (DUF5684)
MSSLFSVVFPALLFASTAAGVAIGVIVYVAVLVFEIAALWLVFTKADRPGWAAIIPFYNYYTILKVVGRPGWWLILFFIPIINFVVWIIVSIDMAKSFDKGTAFAVGLIFLPFIFIPILGFGPARYLEPAAGGPRAI